ncbi:MAG: RNA polymerase sigma factor [Candidatus Staskawiczbacteria bacterium]|nr:RNA polymerase sigma factor [Candidatus Staskawiczbacteria bacterium]
MTEIITDKKLIQQYLKGDEASFEILVKRYLKPIYGFVYKNIGSAADAEDVTQQVFVKVWKNIKKFDQKKALKPWIFQIAKNTSIDFLRKKKTVPFSRFENEKGQNTFVDNIEAPAINLIDALNNRQVLALAMQTLSPKEQKTITLRHNYGLSFKEIAEAFEESINTVKSRYRRTVSALRESIEEA